MPDTRPQGWAGIVADVREIIASRLVLLAVEIVPKSTWFGKQLLLVSHALFTEQARRSVAEYERMRKEAQDA